MSTTKSTTTKSAAKTTTTKAVDTKTTKSILNKKDELISTVAEKTQLTKTKVTDILKTVEDVKMDICVKNAPKKESDGVKVIKFGFGPDTVLAFKPERKGINPKSGDPIKISASVLMTAKFVKSDKVTLNERLGFIKK